MSWLDGIPGGGLLGGALGGLPGFGGGFPNPAGDFHTAGGALGSAGGTLSGIGGGLSGAGNAINGLGLPGIPGLPGPGQILNGVGGAVNAVGQGVGAVGNAIGGIPGAVSSFFSNPGGHTDNNYNMFIPEAGSPAATPQNLGTGGYRGDQSGIIAGLDANKRPPPGPQPFLHPWGGPIVHEPPHPVPRGPNVAEPHGTEIGMWGGGLGGGPLGRQWETSGNGGQSFRTSYANNAASPNWREQGAGPFYTRTWGGG